MLPDQAINDANPPDSGLRQHDGVPLRGNSRTWPSLLTLRPSDQPFTASLLLLVALGFGGWYLWRATTSPGLIELDRSEPGVGKLVVNVNTANAVELMLLPEIGIKTANLIVEERLANGLFRNAEDFGLRIKGMGKLKLPKVAPHLEGWTEEQKKQ